jgi:hypothetical protein
MTLSQDSATINPPSKVEHTRLDLAESSDIVRIRNCLHVFVESTPFFDATAPSVTVSDLVSSRAAVLCKLYQKSSCASNIQVRCEVFPYSQVFKRFLVLNDKTLFVGEVQQTDEAIACGNVRHSLFWVHGLQAVDNIRKGQ